MKDLLLVIPFVESSEDIFLPNIPVAKGAAYSDNGLYGSYFLNKNLQRIAYREAFNYNYVLPTKKSVNFLSELNEGDYLRNAYSLEHLIFDFVEDNKQSKGVGFVVRKKAKVSGNTALDLIAFGVSRGGFSYGQLDKLEKMLLYYIPLFNFSLKAGEPSSNLLQLTASIYKKIFLESSPKGRGYNYTLGKLLYEKKFNFKGFSRMQFNIDPIVYDPERNSLDIVDELPENAIMQNLKLNYNKGRTQMASNDLFVNPLFANLVLYNVTGVGDLLAMIADFTPRFVSRVSEVLLRNPYDEFILVRNKYENKKFGKGLSVVFKTEENGSLSLQGCSNKLYEMSLRLNTNNKSIYKTLDEIGGEKFKYYFTNVKIGIHKDDWEDNWCNILNYTKLNNLPIKGSYSQLKSRSVKWRDFVKKKKEVVVNE